MPRAQNNYETEGKTVEWLVLLQHDCFGLQSLETVQTTLYSHPSLKSNCEK